MARTSVRRTLAHFLLLAALVFVAACDGGGGDPAGPGGPDTLAGADVPTVADLGGGGPDVPAADVPAGLDTGLPRADAGPDVAGPPPDECVPPAIPSVTPGSGQLADPCESGGDCASGLCWATSEVTGCTVGCTIDADCTDGLLCRDVREGLRVCGPPTMTGNPSCDGDEDCLYPYVCFRDQGWCEKPECRFAEDCTEIGTHCNAKSRRCEVDACVAVVQCTYGLDFCVDGRCGPPLCRAHSDCPAGEACNAAYGKCQAAAACDPAAEQPCSVYNEVCVDGLCVPNLCSAAVVCTAPAACDPSAGRCRVPCTGPSSCRAGETCRAGYCHPNAPPVALPQVDVCGVLKPIANVPAGIQVHLDATASSDPELGPLTYTWTFAAAPPGGPFRQGDAVPGVAGPRRAFRPTVPGTYALDLTVTDDAGLTSPAAQVVVFVVP